MNYFMILYVLLVVAIIYYLRLSIRERFIPVKTKELKLSIYPNFLTSSSIFNSMFKRIQASKGDKGYTIRPENAKEVNSILGFPPRIKLTNRSFHKRRRAQSVKDSTEKINTLELVPLLWHCQDVLFKEYRKYFTEVECIKYYHNIFKTSRKNKKPKTLKWHKENCDTSLDLNASVEEGDETYVGMDGISSRLKLSNMGKN